MGYMKEFGRAGQKRTGGIFYEEFLPELQGKKGIETYREMADNDDVVGAILFAVDMLIRGCSWDTQPGGNTPADEEAADFVWQCMNDMTETWIDTISEILSMLTYGWSAHEIVYKRRMGRKKDIRLNSKYNDGRIGWQKLPIRSQETLYRWEYDDNDNLLGLTQMPPPKFDLITIPANKLLLFRTKSSKGNPEGRSILRNSYRSWYFKKRIQEIEGIGIERDLAGLPVMTAPEGVDIWDSDDKNMVSARREAERYVKSIRRDSLEGVVKPEGWKLELLTSGGKRNFDTNAIIERYDTRIAMTVLADFIMLGHQSTGTYNLGSDKSQMFSVAIGAYLDMIAEVFNNKAIPDLIDMNGEAFKDITDYPTIIHGEIENRISVNLATLYKKFQVQDLFHLMNSLKIIFVMPQSCLNVQITQVMAEHHQKRASSKRNNICLHSEKQREYLKKYASPIEVKRVKMRYNVFVICWINTKLR